MTARDRYSLSITCPSCGRVGTVHWSEDGGCYATAAGIARRIEQVDGKFKAKQLDGYRTRYKCKKCGNKWKVGKRPESKDATRTSKL